jgi:5'-methylthioadenosine phosphorylase
MLGIIGGSGLYQMAGLTVREERTVETPFGAPSDAILLGELEGRAVAFLPRHARGHRITPTEINYRANIFAMKALGCTRLLSVSAVGSLSENIHPGEMVCVDQFIDRTKSRASTFFGRGVVGHVALGEPVCASLRTELQSAMRFCEVPGHDSGTYVCIEGPQFSTKAESREFRALGASVIGMTNAPEYKLAREAQLCYATLALVTDYDCWYEGHEVTLPEVLATMHANISRAQHIIRALLKRTKDERTCACGGALAHAVMTDSSLVPDNELPLLRVLKS